MTKFKWQVILQGEMDVPDEVQEAQIQSLVAGGIAVSIGLPHQRHIQVKKDSGLVTPQVQVDPKVIEAAGGKK